MVERSDHWLMIGRMGDGKSTFASQMAPEYLVLDFDGRWDEQGKNTLGRSHVIADSSVVKVAQEMERRLPDLRGKVGTVIVDSGTSVLDYQQSKGRMMVANKVELGLKIKADDVHRIKADMMRVLSGAILQYHCSSLWIFHEEDSSTDGNKKTRTTISTTELERLKKHLSAVLFIVRKDGRRGVKVNWCRYKEGLAEGQVIWDTEGMWRGVPDRLSVFLREFRGTEGYNGNAYSLAWLQQFLADKKGVAFESLDEMRARLGIETEPLWFDRNAWSVFVERAAVKA